MPYFIYRISSPKKLEYIDQKTVYQEAKGVVKALRNQQEKGDETTVRMIFAKTTGEAEKLLSAPKDERVIGED